MPAKKPTAKPTKAKKPVAKKSAASKPSAAKKKAPPAKAKPAAKSAPRLAVKAAPPPKAAAKPKAKVAPVPAPKPPLPRPAAAARPAVPARPAALPETPRPRPVPPGPVVTTRSSATFRPAPVEGEDEGLDSGQSLLSGPRNVQPYRPKKGEQYMNAGQVEHFRKILLAWKRDLMEEVDRTVTHMKDEAANPPDPNDRATLESEFSLELRTRDRERKLIRKIDEALKRIEDGTYGYCLETGEEIGIKRLEARPVATLSLEAQERRERREKQYGDRDDRYR
jgi:DnaK suppressor protein